jgi:hypothetical protein
MSRIVKPSHRMKRFLTVLLLFAGFALLFLGAVCVLAWLLVPLNSKPTSGPSWPLAGIGLCLMLAGRAIRRMGLCRWRAATGREVVR